MSALDAFMITWSRARATFGQGVPSDGSRFDQSSQFRQLQNQVESAAPGSKWSGAASDSYADANANHARRLGNIGELDQRLGAEVQRSAAVVTAGRRDLDAVKQWVSDAAATVPKTAAGQRMLWPIVSKGSAEIQEIITRSNGELSSIAGRIQGLGSEYQALGDDGAGKGGTHVDKRPPIPNTTFDIKDIKLTDGLGPPNTDEIGPGAYYPRPQVGEQPSPPEAPLDYRDIEYTGETGLAPRPGMVELVPNSGAWVPDPDASGFVPKPPEVPVDMAEAHIMQRGELAPAGMVPLYPGSLIAIPDPDAGAPR
jgi:hypothetical protein